MKLPALATHESNNIPPILIVDKIGVIGEELARALCQDFLIVLLSPNPVLGNERIIHVPFKKRIPKAPDNRYSKIFIVDDGHLVTRQSAFSFIEKAKESDSPFFFIGSIRNVDIAHADQIAESYSNSKVLIFGDLFDKNIFFGQEASINNFILQARKTGKIEVEGNGLSLSFPITFEDTIKLVIKASYLDISQKVILLFYPHPITDISLANTFKKINPDIKVDFVKEKQERRIYIPAGGQHAIGKYDLEKKIRNLELEDAENRQIKIVGKESRRTFIRPVLTLLLILLFILLLPFLTTLAYSKLGQWGIDKARESIVHGQFDNARKQAKNSKTFFGIARKTSEILIWQAKFFGIENSAKQIRAKALSGESISQAGIYLIDSSYLIGDIYSGKSKDPKNDFLKASNSLKGALGLIEKTKAHGPLPSNISQDFDDISPLIDLFSSSSDILPDILGFEKEKTYLVLLQNETTARPGGGAIESFGVLKIKNAKVSDFTVYDSSWLDERLETTIDPPFMLRRYMSIDALNLENAGVDPDFVNNAIAASNIYFLATKEKVDGVIALDVSFLKNIISGLGFVTVSGQKITQENILGAVSFQNSLEKKSFLGEIVKSLVEEFEKKDTPYFELSKQLGKSINQKHLLFASPTSSYQNIFTANGWSSSIWDNRSKENNKVNDFVGLSEANLGEEGVNYYVSRSVSKKITVGDKGKITSTLTIGFKNNKKDESGKAATYKNYLQLILPEATKIESLEIDGKKVKIEKATVDPLVYESPGFKPPTGLEVEERNQMDKSIFGFLIMVPAGSIKTVTVSYALPYSTVPSQRSFNYSLKIYKQPGVASYPFDLTFTLPQNYHVIGSDSSYSKEIINDEELSFIIAQK